MAFRLPRAARRAVPSAAAAAAWAVSPEGGTGPGARTPRETSGGRVRNSWAARCEAPVPRKSEAPYTLADAAGAPVPGRPGDAGDALVSRVRRGTE